MRNGSDNKFLIKNYIWFYPLISAILMALSFPPFSIWPLGLVALVPYFFTLFKVQNGKQALQSSFFMGTFLIYTGFYWVSDVAVNFGGLPWIVGKIILVAFSLFGEMQFLFFGLAFYYWFHRKQKTSDWIHVLVMGIFYVGFDYLYPKIFPNQIGHGLYGWFSFAQVAEITGVPGVTFFLVIANAAFAFFLKNLFEKDGSVKNSIPLIVVVATMILISVWGMRRVNEIEARVVGFNKLIKLSMIQANIGDVDKLASESGLKSATDKVLATYRSLSEKTVKEFSPDLIIWPETAYPLLYTNMQNLNANNSGSARDQFILDLTKSLATPLIFGGYSTDGKKDYNTIFYVAPDGKLLGQYRKNILLAFGEYVPLGPFGPLVQSIIPTIADFGRGLGPMVFEYKNRSGQSIRFSPQICYEGIDTDFTRACALKGVDFILNVTNDSWFGNSAEPYIHFMLTAFRAIELRVPLVRTTNTGFSAVVDSTGKITQQSELFKESVIESELRLPTDEQKFPKTIYFLWGEWFGKTLGVLAIFLTMLLLIPKSSKRQRIRGRSIQTD